MPPEPEEDEDAPPMPGAVNRQPRIGAVPGERAADYQEKNRRAITGF
jgi:hypothetical protein